MGKVLNFPLKQYFHNIFQGIRQKQNELLQKKIDYLFDEAYKFFLDEYLDRVAKEQIADLPPFFYTTGKVICSEARSNAEQVMIDVIRDGRVNQCYTKRLRQIKELNLR